MNLDHLWKTKLEGKAWQIKEEFLPLLELMQTRSIQSVLEIGSYKGGTAQAFLELGCKVTCVDKLILPELFELAQEYPGLVIHQGTSDTVKFTDNTTFDMLFIDGDHTMDWVRSDYLRYRKHIPSGGLIVFHDTADTLHHEQHDCAVPKYWQMIKSDFKETRQFHAGAIWGGISVGFV